MTQENLIQILIVSLKKLKQKRLKDNEGESSENKDASGKTEEAKDNNSDSGSGLREEE